MYLVKNLENTIMQTGNNGKRMSYGGSICMLSLLAVLAASVAACAPTSAAVRKVKAPSKIFLNVKAVAVRDTSAIIRWDTNIAATGRIEYGLDRKYGKLTKEEGLSYWHPVRIAGLAPGKKYHFRIRAVDYKGKESISRDYTFTTRTTGELEKIIRAARKSRDLPRTYYVKPDGNDANDGLSLKTAWVSLRHAARKAEAGDTIHVADGKYSFVQFANHHGIPEAPITLKAHKSRRVTTSQISIRANHITIDGVVCRYDGGGFGIDARNVTGIKILNCEVRMARKGVDCIYFRDVTYSVIENCTVHDAGWNGIGLKPTRKHPSSGNHVILRNTKVYDCPRHNGFDIQGDYITIENCHSHDTRLAPLRANGGEYWVINNCTWEKGNNGINFGGVWRDVLVLKNKIRGPICGSNMRGVTNMTVHGNHITCPSYGIGQYGGKKVLIEGNEVHSPEKSGYTYGITKGNAVIRNEKRSPYNVRSMRGAAVTVEYTDGRKFSVDGKGEYTTYTFSSGTHRIAVIQ